MRVTESAAYLKGLAEGLDLNEESKEGKIITRMLDVIEELAARVTDLEDEVDELYSYIEEMGEDIISIEDDLYGEAEYDDLDDLLLEDDEDYEGEDTQYYEIDCPSCGETICFADDIDVEKLVCPACGEVVGEIELCDEDCENCSAKDVCDN